ncbi:MAG: hypothetical protein ACLFR2_06550 [Candidatus Kapaibacterium sp.]
MADIDIQKKRFPKWPWFVAAIVVIILIFIWSGVLTDNENEPDRVVGIVDGTAGEVEVIEEEVPKAVNDYKVLVDGHDLEIMLDMSHEFTVKGLSTLHRAIQEISNKEDYSSPEFQKNSEQLQGIINDVSAEAQVANPEMMSKGFKLAAENLKLLQESEFQALKTEMDKTIQAADNIKPDMPVTRQDQTLENFFNSSNDLIQHMAL